MRKRLFFLAVLLSLLYGQGIAQQPGTLQWATLTNPSAGPDTLRSVKVQADGKLVVAGNSYQGGYMAIGIGRYLNGGLDPSFGLNGIATLMLDSAHTIAHAVEIQSDSSIVAAGGYRKGTTGDFILVRYKPDGSLDSSFGAHGIVRTDINSGSFDVATALVIQTDGKIVVAGRFGSSLALCRYKPDGSSDSSFDLDGKLTIAAVAGATSMGLQTNGKLVVCCGNSVVRLQTDGSLDAGFGTNGIAGISNYSYSLAIQNDGKILVAGGNFVVQRLDTVGRVDNSFGTNGLTGTGGFVTGSNTGQGAFWVCLQPDGRILAGGWAKFCILGNCRAFAISRYKSNGIRDSSFGYQGKVVLYALSRDDEAATSYAAAITPGNGLAVVGLENEDGIISGNDKWVVAGFYLGPSLGVQPVPEGDGSLTVAPNPAENVARIQSARIENGTWQLSLCDLTGRTLYHETWMVTNHVLDQTISLDGSPAGVYLMKLNNGSTTKTLKLTKR